jgi:hypothetical protein
MAMDRGTINVSRDWYEFLRTRAFNERRKIKVIVEEALEVAFGPPPPAATNMGSEESEPPTSGV